MGVPSQAKRAACSLAWAFKAHSLCSKNAASFLRVAAIGCVAREGAVNKNFIYVMVGLLLGIALGTASYYSFPDKAVAADVAKYMSLVSSIFLKLIKMIIGPLVLSTLVVGIGHMGDAST